MCLRKKKVGQIPGYYSDATAINQASLCARSVDNTGDDGNAIRHLGKKKKKKGPISAKIKTVLHISSK